MKPGGSRLRYSDDGGRRGLNTDRPGLLMCFNTSSSSLSTLSLRLCLLPVLNSLLTDMMGVFGLAGGLETEVTTTGLV